MLRQQKAMAGRPRQDAEELLWRRAVLGQATTQACRLACGEILSTRGCKARNATDRCVATTRADRRARAARDSSSSVNKLSSSCGNTEAARSMAARPDAQFVTIRKMCPSSAVYCAICLPSSSFASHTSQLACAVLSHGHVYDLRQSPFAPPPITTLWGFSGGGLRRYCIPTRRL